MMLFRPVALVMPVVFAIYIPTCAPQIKPTATPQDVRMDELWKEPADLATRDLFWGQGGKEHAPDPDAVYKFKERKQQGTNPGVTVVDPEGREWHVKQPPTKNKQGPEGPTEVTLSRILWAVGYHQPPEYFVKEFTMDGGEPQEKQHGKQHGKQQEQPLGKHAEPGGRFRLEDKNLLKKQGTWSWQQNPFVGTRPYNGLLVILMVFNSSDIKNDNNTLYEVAKPAEGEPKVWYVVRDLGTALGETAKLFPVRMNPDLYEKHGFVIGMKNGFVRFDYHGWHQELVRDRITPSDVRWGCELLSRLSDAQWADAFRAGGFESALAQRFITRARQKVREGLQLENAPARTALDRTDTAGWLATPVSAP